MLFSLLAAAAEWFALQAAYGAVDVARRIGFAIWPTVVLGGMVVSILQAAILDLHVEREARGHWSLLAVPMLCLNGALVALTSPGPLGLAPGMARAVLGGGAWVVLMLLLGCTLGWFWTKAGGAWRSNAVTMSAAFGGGLLLAAAGESFQRGFVVWPISYGSVSVQWLLAGTILRNLWVGFAFGRPTRE